MGQMWVPARSRFAIAQREPRLLAHGVRPIGQTRVHGGLRLESFIEVNGRNVTDRVTGYSKLLATNAVTGASRWGQYGTPSNVEDVLVSGFPVEINDATLVVIRFRTADYDLTSSTSFATNKPYVGLVGESTNRLLLGSSTVYATDETMTLAAANSSGRRYITESFSADVDYTIVLALVDGLWSFWRDGIPLTTYSGNSGSTISALSYSTLDIGVAQYSADPKAGGYTWQFYSGNCSAALAQLLSSDPFALMRPANATPYLFPVAASGAAGYDETATITATATVAATESYTAPAFDETASIAATATVSASEAYTAPAYDETASVTAAATVTASETFGAGAFDETTSIAAAATVSASETYTAPAYDETASVTAATTVTATEVFTEPGSAFNETADISAAATVSASESYTAPAYNETATITFAALVEASEIYVGPGSGETASITGTVTVEASETWEPPHYSETAAIIGLLSVTAVHTFTTPSALPAGISRLSAERVGGFFAERIGRA